jgi:hypothetical protein
VGETGARPREEGERKERKRGSERGKYETGGRGKGGRRERSTKRERDSGNTQYITKTDKSSSLLACCRRHEG